MQPSFVYTLYEYYDFKKSIENDDFVFIQIRWSILVAIK